MQPLPSLCACLALLVIAAVSFIVDPHGAGLCAIGVGIAIANMSLKEVRELAGKLLKRMEELRDGFQARMKEGKAGADLWPENTRQQWTEVNEQLDQCQERMQTLQEETELVRREAEARDWLGRSARDGRPHLDDRAGPDTDRSYGELGFATREEALAYQQNQRDRHLAFQSWAATEIADELITDGHREACERLRFTPSVRQIRLRFLETEEYRGIQTRLRSVVHDPIRREALVRDIVEGRALSAVTGGAGGYLVAPPRLVAAIEVAMLQFGAMLQVADTITTDTGEEIGWPYVDDTSNEGAYVDESEDAQDQGEPNPSFEQVKWRAHDFSSKFLKVPFSLSRDSIVNIDLLIGRLVGERIGRKISSEATTGELRVRGIVPRSAAGNTAAGATAIVYDDLIKLETSLDSGFDQGAGYMFHKNILEKLRLLKDGASRPLWVMNLAQGVPPTLNGKPYTVNHSMASSVASGNKTVLYGDFSYYKLRRVGPSLQIVRLVERFAEKRQTGYIGYASADGNLMRPNSAASCPVKHLVQP